MTLKDVFYQNLKATRTSLGITQAQMAELLMMDTRSYVELDHGNSCCNALTFALFLLYCCPDSHLFLDDLKEAFDEIPAKVG